MSTLQVDTINDSSGNLNPTLVAGTAQATTSGTELDFTGIPAGVKRVTVLFDGVSLSGTDNILVQLGDAGGVEATGYSSGGHLDGSDSGNILSSTGFPMAAGANARGTRGSLVIERVDTNDWVSRSVGYITDSTSHYNWAGGGIKTLSDTLTQVRVTRTGSDTFDAGQVNILYE